MTKTNLFPPLRELPPGRLEAREHHLLAEIGREPERPRLPLRSVHLFDRPRPRRSAVAVSVAVAALAGVGAAISAGLGAFNGIGAAQHPRTRADVIDPATAAYMEDKNCNGPGEPTCQGRIVGLQLDTARHIGRLPDGQNIYVLTCAQNDLCTVVGPPHPTWTVNRPLSNSHPSTIFTYYAPGSDAATRWITFGVAFDGVTSVSFQPTQAADGGPAGPKVTVPVNDNLWTYQTDNAQPPYALQSVSAHFADGTTVVEPPTGTNCAAC
jgi:hypothetical protein